MKINSTDLNMGSSRRRRLWSASALPFPLPSRLCLARGVPELVQVFP